MGAIINIEAVDRSRKDGEVHSLHDTRGHLGFCCSLLLRTTEFARTGREPLRLDYERCDREISQMPPNASEHWRLAKTQEREKMCRNHLRLPDKELEEQAIETVKEHPEWDWSKGWSPWPDGSIRPAAEVEQQMDEAFENAKEKMKRYPNPPYP